MALPLQAGDIGESSKLNVRLGKHALVYGESLFFGDNGIARAQGPMNVQKLFVFPKCPSSRRLFFQFPRCQHSFRCPAP